MRRRSTRPSARRYSCSVCCSLANSP